MFLAKSAINKLFKKFTAAKSLALAHFAIAYWKDIFPENFFHVKIYPGLNQSPTHTNFLTAAQAKIGNPWLLYPTQKIEKAFAFDFFLIII